MAADYIDEANLNSNWYWYYVFFLLLAIAMDRNNRKSLRLPPQHYINAKKPECVEQENRNNKTI
ncbi:hypothetical protein DERF_004660 [Dermatophagoides farinae]|uniref:Uncharacterized protein n=1 Tax=Dermatophagoides farinae TaxID=6954 RepID=A0A922I475_DERFA|nr:hypothetical protein DERF_004660 [Dermatophagoides farinae]